MTMIERGGVAGHCGKPRRTQCNPADPTGPCPCKDELIGEIIAHGSPVDYGPDYSPPPTPSPGSSDLDDDPGGR